jgi:hypothetical protein
LDFCNNIGPLRQFASGPELECSGFERRGSVTRVTWLCKNSAI